MSAIDAIRWPEDGLVPAVIQHPGSGAVLMTGFMNRDALARTLETGMVHFWSRSRQALWLKGETSGNRLSAQEVRVNCDRNSLLVLAIPAGPTCHDGYDTCYYRRLGADGSLVVIETQRFDPATVYGSHPEEDPTGEWLGAYAWLRDNDLSAQSSTSARLHGDGADLPGRVADELGELAGVLDGSHRHRGETDDALLEGSQSLYWLALVATKRDVGWPQVRPDRALATVEPGISRSSAAAMLRAEGAGWRDAAITAITPEQVHAAMAIVAQGVATVGLDPLDLIRADLADLRSRAYLAGYFSRG